MRSELQAASVRVPCSTSNLGAGFDTLGLALDRYLEASFQPGDDPLTLVRTGTLAGLGKGKGTDLVAETFRASLASESVAPRGTLTLSSTIPLARGLGSSAAALLAGADLALASLGRARADEETFAIAYEREGHGDNAAPCLFGGLQAVAAGPDGLRVVELQLSPEVGFAYAGPAQGVATAKARSVLPEEVPLTAAVKQLGRITALVQGLAVADPELIRIGVEDELHVAVRLPMIKAGAATMAAGYEAGAWAVTISGAGSGLIAMCAPARAQEVAAAMQDCLARDDEEGDAEGFVLRPDFAGLVRL